MAVLSSGEVRDLLELDVQRAVDRGVRAFLKTAIDAWVAKFSSPTAVVAAVAPAGGRAPDYASSDLIVSLGEIHGWWDDSVDKRIMPAIERAWVDAYASRGVASTSLDAAVPYLAKVRDRLVQGLQPSLPQDAFDRVRETIANSVSLGYDNKKTATAIAKTLGWNKDAQYWTGVKKDAYNKIDSILDKIGPPGTPAREFARLNDPVVNQLQRAAGLATSHIEADASHWRNRATTIARTETTGAYNAGALQSLMDEGFPYKQWVATAGMRTRETHAAANGQQTRTELPFMIGGFAMMMPGDPNGAASEVINCRCTIIGVDDIGVKEETAEFGEDAARAAQPVFDRATQVAPGYLNLMKTLAAKTGQSLKGEEYAVKGFNSLARKIQGESSGMLDRMAAAAADISDSVRFTMISSESAYSKSVISVLDDLNASGWGIRFKNAWAVPDRAYQGINVALVSPDGVKVELQFHTARSYTMKSLELMHGLYEKQRVLPSGDPMIAFYEKMMLQLYRSLPVPPKARSMKYPP